MSSRAAVALIPFGLAAGAFAGAVRPSVPWEDVWRIREAAFDALVHWVDDVQTDPGSLFERADRPVLPESPACAWVRAEPRAAAAALEKVLADGVDLGEAVLAGFLNLQTALPAVVDGWTALEEPAYNGESPLPETPLLRDFRQLQGIAFVIERLAGKPLHEAVRLSSAQREHLAARSRLDGDDAARAILTAVGP